MTAPPISKTVTIDRPRPHVHQYLGPRRRRIPDRQAALIATELTTRKTTLEGLSGARRSPPERVRVEIMSHAVLISSSSIMICCSALAAAEPVPPRPVVQ